MTAYEDCLTATSTQASPGTSFPPTTKRMHDLSSRKLSWIASTT